MMHGQTNIKFTKSLSILFQCIYHIVYYSNGLHAITPYSRFIFGKSIAVALFKKYDGPCRNNVLSSVPERPAAGPDSYPF